MHIYVNTPRGSSRPYMYMHPGVWHAGHAFIYIYIYMACRGGPPAIFIYTRGVAPGHMYIYNIYTSMLGWAPGHAYIYTCRGGPPAS